MKVVAIPLINQMRTNNPAHTHAARMATRLEGNQEGRPYSASFQSSSRFISNYYQHPNHFQQRYPTPTPICGLRSFPHKGSKLQILKKTL
jgi:hypothetical protein